MEGGGGAGENKKLKKIFWDFFVVQKVDRDLFPRFLFSNHIRIHVPLCTP